MRSSAINAHAAGGNNVAASDCGLGLYCDTSLDAPRCANANKTVGTECGCLDCASELYCEFANATSACKAYKAENESCTSTDKCGAGLECMAGACRKVASLSLGEQCHGDSRECAGGIAGASCVADGTGIARCTVPGLLGAPCDPELAPEKTCALNFDLTCDKASLSCQPLPALGESCQKYCADHTNVFCAHTNSTDPSGTCQPRVGLGSKCGKEPQDAGSSCSSSSCSASSSASDSGCRLDLKCDSTTRTCVARIKTTCR